MYTGVKQHTCTDDGTIGPVRNFPRKNYCTFQVYTGNILAIQYITYVMNQLSLLVTVTMCLKLQHLLRTRLCACHANGQINAQQ